MTYGLAGVLDAGGVVDHEARRLDIGGHLGEGELHGLEFGDGFAELTAGLCIFGCVAPCALGEAEHLRANADTAFVQGFDGDLVALAGLAENSLAGQLAVVEE